jgi:coenzyme F420-0:L-glutamate ligase / coenzyme F420-1:gamma-L-glutamate ligase
VLTVTALEGLPEVRPGDKLHELIAGALGAAALGDDDLLVVAHKVVSKAEGRIRTLDSITPGPRARELAELLAKDPRHVQAVLDESREVLRAERGVMICETHHGFVCANAGVDASNVDQPNTLVLLPTDPDASARRLRSELHSLTGRRPGVLITDSFGRAWRQGQAEIALGCAGLMPLEDWRGRHDSVGRELRATWIAVADQLASAADLARRKDSRQPVVLIKGAERWLTEDDGPGAAAVLRPRQDDLFR